MEMDIQRTSNKNISLSRCLCSVIILFVITHEKTANDEDNNNNNIDGKRRYVKFV